MEKLTLFGTFYGLWKLILNVYIINCCMVTCFREMYLSFSNVAGMELAFMDSYGVPVELCKSKACETVRVKLIQFGRFRRNCRSCDGYPRQNLPKVS